MSAFLAPNRPGSSTVARSEGREKEKERKGIRGREREGVREGERREKERKGGDRY